MSISNKEWVKKLKAVHAQMRETIQQESAGITVRMATITCGCGSIRSLVNMYKCLYCNEYYCVSCAQEHFGKTVAQHRAENPIEDENDVVV